eukprot:GHVR01049738.1.p1 GENE.GHVR01049738.1~~GHVR01049738.1.p1  ORF type:complete len:129 (+),score=23.82 GHVR01049738.1:864-1250(+)
MYNIYNIFFQVFPHTNICTFFAAAWGIFLFGVFMTFLAFISEIITLFGVCLFLSSSLTLLIAVLAFISLFGGYLFYVSLLFSEESEGFTANFEPGRSFWAVTLGVIVSLFACLFSLCVYAQLRTTKKR